MLVRICGCMFNKRNFMGKETWLNFWKMSHHDDERDGGYSQMGEYHSENEISYLVGKQLQYAQKSNYFNP